MQVKSLILAVVLSIISLSSFAEVVNINKADAAAFQHYLKGIGVKKANSIVQYRLEHKRFKSLAEIKEVSGIGEKIFKKIKSNLSLTEGVVSLSKTKAKVIKKKVKSKAVINKVEKKAEKKIDVVTEDEVENTETEKSTEI
jgi:competence protein ComEA